MKKKITLFGFVGAVAKAAVTTGAIVGGACLGCKVSNLALDVTPVPVADEVADLIVVASTGAGGAAGYAVSEVINKEIDSSTRRYQTIREIMKG